MQSGVPGEKCGLPERRAAVEGWGYVLERRGVCVCVKEVQWSLRAASVWALGHACVF